MDGSSDDSVPLHAEDIKSQLNEGGKPFDQVDSVDDAEESIIGSENTAKFS